MMCLILAFSHFFILVSADNVRAVIYLTVSTAARSDGVTEQHYSAFLNVMGIQLRAPTV